MTESLAQLAARVAATPGAARRVADLMAARAARDAARAAQLAAFGPGPFEPAASYTARADTAGGNSQDASRRGAYSLARAYRLHEDGLRALAAHVETVQGVPVAPWVLAWRQRSQEQLRAKPVPAGIDRAARLHSMRFDREVCSWARWRAHEAGLLMAAADDDLARLAAGRDHWHRWGLPPPEETAQRTAAGVLQRLACEAAWRRAARKAWAQAREFAHIVNGRVSARAGRYVSDELLAHVKRRKTETRQMLESMVAVADDGEQVQLSVCVDASPSNPRVRRSEMMAQVRGLEDLAEYRGDASRFVTLTAPSQYHRMCHADGKVWENPKWNGCSPKDAQAYMAGMWDGAVREAREAGIVWYALRAVQPHHDGCPHWHVVLWCEPARADELTAIMRRHALAVDGDEPGAAVRRCDVKVIDPERGTATGYAIRYIARAIDGCGLQTLTEADDEGQVRNASAQGEAQAMVARVVAWASVWGIRLFQFLGSPPKVVHRELRRLRDETAPQWTLEKLREAADSGDWREWIDLMAGPCVPRRQRPVHVLRVPDARLNRYGEPAPDSIKGVQLTFEFWNDKPTHAEVQALAALPYATHDGVTTRTGYRLAGRYLRAAYEARREAWRTDAPRVITRRRRWVLVAAAKAAAVHFASPWTRVNNCRDIAPGDPATWPGFVPLPPVQPGGIPAPPRPGA